jgi:hypothetical protein
MPFKDTPPRKRIEYRDENIRVSITAGVSATKTVSKDGYGLKRYIYYCLTEIR